MSSNETEESAIRLEAIYNKIEKEASEEALMWPWGYSQRDYDDGKPRPAMVVNADRKEYYKKGAIPYGEKWHEAEELLDKMAKALELIKVWCKESGLKHADIGNSIHMAVYHSLHQANQTLTDYQTYKQGKQSKDIL